MQAVAVQPQSRRVALVAHQTPRITRATEVRLRMLEVGVCGTDREIACFEYGTPPDGQQHLVIGHESLGEVVETGAAVTGLEVGDLVVPMVRRPCPHDHCAACRQDRQDFCYTGDFVERGIKQSHGFMTPHVVEDQRYLVPVPRELRDVAVLVEPLTIAEKALAELAVVQQRLPWACSIARGSERHSCPRALVLGAHPVGLLGAMALRNAGFDTVVYSKSPAPNPSADVVAAIGGRYVSSEEVGVDELAELVGGIDVVFEAVGASQLAFDVLRVLGTNGIFIFTGVPARKGPIEVDADLLMRNLVLKNQVVLGSVNASRADFERAIADLSDFMVRWPDAVRGLISGRHPLDAFERLLTTRPGGIKHVLVLDGASP